MKLRYKRLSEKVEAILKDNLAKVDGKPLFVDLGCGRGEFALYLKKAWGNAEPWNYVGFEPSREQLGQRDIPNLGMGFVQSTAEQLPLQDMVAQGILLKEALDHCYDPAKVFAETKRLLKPGGVFVVTITNDKSYFKRLLPWVNKAHKATQTDHLYFFGPNDLVKLAKEGSFDRVSVETYNYLKFPRFLEVVLGFFGEPICRGLLSLTDSIGKILLPGMGGGIILKAYTKERP